MRLLLALCLLAGCAPLIGRGSWQIQLLRKPAHPEGGRVRYLKAGGGGVDPVLNRTYAEDEMILACGSKYEIAYESEELGAAGFQGGLTGAERWQVITFRCAK